MNDAREMLELADRIAPIAGRCSIEADRYILIEAVRALRIASERLAAATLDRRNPRSQPTKGPNYVR